MIDKSLHFGGQNFFFAKFDDTDGTYDYVGYMDKKGTILIARLTKAYDEQLFWVGKGDLATIWTEKETYDYVLPNELEDIQI